MYDHFIALHVRDLGFFSCILHTTVTLSTIGGSTGLLKWTRTRYGEHQPWQHPQVVDLPCGVGLCRRIHSGHNTQYNKVQWYKGGKQERRPDKVARFVSFEESGIAPHLPRQYYFGLSFNCPT